MASFQKLNNMKTPVTYGGMAKRIVIYINMYDAEELKAPKGFKFKSEK
jgi:hypothetical protein